MTPSPDTSPNYDVFKKELNIDIESISIGTKYEDSNIFNDIAVATHYRNVYEQSKYECRHLFDPDFTWSKEEEAKVVRKNDWNVTFLTFIMFTALDFDRYNISQALSDNMLDNLHMSTNDYNTANTINLVCFLVSELPSQLISKKIGGDVWIPIQICLWSIVSMCQAAVTTKNGFYTTRALLGLLQGGFICDICLWMSYFFTSKELPFRLSLFYTANPLAAVWSSLLSFALLKIKTGGIMDQSWRWLFLIEGILTLFVGIYSFFGMPPSPAQTKSWYCKDGWYTESEEKIVVNRVLRDDPSKGDMHNREPVRPKELLEVLLDFDLLPIYIIRLLSDIGAQPVSTYMALTLRKLGFNTYQTNALNIPYNVLQAITMCLLGYFSEVINERSLLSLITPIWVLAGLLPLRFWPGAQINVWGTYALLTILLGHPPLWALSISWCSANSNSVRTRAVSAALVNIFSQVANITSANLYRSSDSPLYHKGNNSLIGIACGALVSCLLTKLYYIQRNKAREKKWASFSEQEKLEYCTKTSDEGNKRLDFRFVH
ncbi:similar to Saccharomyces cerevisiae YIL166C Putative protein with similarity to the allantoate permease (Dal5p) subfamily of the major facilitator superfamily [Maudiozyma saulgeensis]|uniref:Major facilitator superfamily (MFS) profile domain-containing protein n=1 Tax=Maudiozyma saulgeensis TaxID=1789683 RepID=A0A1X7QWV3_9SACH|nr:similar to Saccharomyces cerevisiae YIL166C Putative protein with similarity to the allantoate permease (Dal5p) subfamily of the major facilitator superfamily [Kazachstania saulgeensis]